MLSSAHEIWHNELLPPHKITQASGLLTASYLFSKRFLYLNILDFSLRSFCKQGYFFWTYKNYIAKYSLRLFLNQYNKLTENNFKFHIKS